MINLFKPNKKIDKIIDKVTYIFMGIVVLSLAIHLIAS